MSRSAAAAPREIAFLVYPGAQTLDVAGPLEVFAAASALAGGRAYRTRILAERAGPVRMWSGLELVADSACATLRSAPDTLLVSGGVQPAALPEVATPARLAWLRRQAPRVRRIGAICTGSFLLAEAGLLHGRRATTHWSAVDELARRHPAIEVERDALFVRDGHVYTSAGVTAGMDLALALVEEDLGRELALAVARQLVLFLKRPGGQSQFSATLAAQTRASGALSGLPAWIADHLDEDLSVPVLARRAAMSPRNFARVFQREIGETPARYVEALRVERARSLLDRPDIPLGEVARRCGFGSTERLRRSFLRRLRVVPHAYRERFA